MKIYNGDIEVLDVICDDASYVSNAIMGEHQAVIKFSLSEYIALPMLSFVTINGVRYVLYEPPVVKKVNSRNYEYTVTMRAESEAAKRWKLRNLVDGRLEFSMTAKPHEFVELIIGNLNLRDEGWTAGECIDAIEATISFSHNNCLEALQQIANTFNTEYEIAGKTIHLRKVEYFKDEPLHLSYGKGNGLLPNITRSNYDESRIGVLYVQGGDRNIDRSRYEASTLHLPKGGRIGYDGTHYEDEDGYSPDAARIYQADAAGMFITNAAGASTDEEDSIDCSSIYPKRVGEVSALVVVDADRNLFDIIDDTIPDALDYEECLIAGQSLTVIFQSGMLAGKEFEAKYIHADRRFEIVPQEIDGVVMPGGDYIPQSGDRYAVFGCMLPDAYINDESTKTGAEWDMMREAVKVLYEREDARFTINANLDGIWSKKNWETVGEKIRIGGYISFTDESMASEGLLIRITSIKTYINKPHSPTIELSNKVVQSSFSSSMQAIKVADLTISESQKSANRYTQIYSKYTVNNLFELVTVSEEKKDADGNITQPAEYAIKAKYDLFSVGGISAYGFSGTGSGGGTASVDVTAVLKEGVHIATINGVNIFAPKGGASSWAELTGRPSWITDPAPGVLTFPNNAGYITSAALSGYATTEYVAQTYVKLTDFNSYKSVVSKNIADSAQEVKDWVTGKCYGKSLGINGNYIRLLDEDGIELNKVIVPYAAYTDQLGATNSTATVSIYGEVKMKNGSLAVAGNVNANGNLSTGGSLSVTGESHFSSSVYIGDAANVSAKYLWFGYRGIFFEGEGATSGNPWYGTLCTHDAYTHKSINLRCFNGWTQINQLAVGPDFLTGAPSPSYTLDVLGTLRASTSVKTGDCHANNFILSDNDGTYDYGRIVTPAWKARIDMSEAYNGMIALACGGAEYLSMNAAEGVIRSLKELYITHDDGLRIGNAYLRYDTVNNALYVTGQNGAQVHLYATGGIAAYSGLGSGITQLANLSLTGRLTAASVKANTYKIGENNDLYEESNGQLYFSLYDKFFIGGYDTYFNSDGGLFLQNGINIGSTDANHGITDLYADGSYVYITINGKRYRFTPSSTTTV